MNIITIENVDKNFDGYNIFKNLNISIKKGSFVCIVGKSGIGKSTFLRIVAGFESINSGNIYIDGNVVKTPGIDRMVVFQDFNQLFPWKTVIQNVEFPLKLQKSMDKKQVRKFSYDLLKKVGLNGWENKYPHMLSGGMKQRVAIARALAVRPKILLMDEPFGSVDQNTKKILQNLTLDIWEKENLTILFVTHDLNEAIKLSTDIVIINDMKIKIIKNEMPYPRKIKDKQFDEMLNMHFKNLL